MNEEDTRKGKEFVDHLFKNPNITGEPILIAEGILINFIVQNMDQLKVTFKTPQFFPHLKWNEVLQILFTDLYNRVTDDVMPFLKEFIDKVNTDVLNKLSDGSELPSEFHREKLQNFLDDIFKNKDVRYNMNSTISIIKHKVLDNYIHEVYNQRGFLFNEIVRVQKTNIECDDYISFLKIMLVVRCAAYVKIECPTMGISHKISITEATKMRGKFDNYLEELIKYVKNYLPNLSEKSIKLAVKSNLNMKKTALDEGSSRLLFILCARYHNYKHLEKVDRGAEAPDKSWFAIARKNCEHYGFDKRMIDELYRIAGDNNW